MDPNLVPTLRDVEGRAIKIVTVENNEIKINESEIKGIMDKANPTYPIAILSTCGGYRQGKSTLLNFFLKYLCNYENSKFPTEVGEMPKWIDENDSIKYGFRTAGGMRGVTNGIDLWSEVFTITNNNGTFNIILMDTQGFFDNKNTVNSDKCIFGISTMLSSYQIFNFINNISTLLYNYCGDMASFVQKYQNIENEKPFEHMEFLCRDYSNFTDPSNVDQCIQEGKSFIEDYLAESAPENHNSQLKVESMYKKITSFCLPNPGDQVACVNFDGSISKFNKLFLKLIGIYVEEVIRTIRPLTVRNQFLTASNGFTYLCNICKAFSDPSNFPPADNLITIQDLVKIRVAAKEIVNIAKRRLWDTFYPGRRYMNPSSLDDTYKQAKLDAENGFRKEFPNHSELIELEYNEMIQQIDDYYSMVFNTNHGIEPYERYGRKMYGLFGPRIHKTIYPELKYAPPRP